MFPNTISQPFGFGIQDTPPTTLYGFPPGKNIGRYIIVYPNLAQALDFDGVNDRAASTFASFAWPADFSMVGWFVPDTAVGNQFIGGTTSVYGGNGIHVYQNSTNLRFTAQAGLDLVVSSTLAAGTRYHFGLTLNSARQWVFYLNGNNVSSGTLTVGQMPSLYLGHFFGGTGLGPFNGRLANWIFFSRVLSPPEIFAFFQSRLVYPQNTTGVLGAYPFNQLAPLATQTPDISGNGRHLDLINFPANPIVPF